MLTCEALHDILPEVRRAYDSIPQFRKEIKIIARSMESVKDQQSILNAAEKIVGGGLDSIEPSTISTDHKNFDIPERPIKNEALRRRV